MKQSFLGLLLLAAISCTPAANTSSNQNRYSVELVDKLGAGDIQEAVTVRQNGRTLATLNLDRNHREVSTTINFNSPGPHVLYLSSLTVDGAGNKVSGSGKVEINLSGSGRQRYNLMGTYASGKNTLTIQPL